MPNHHATVAGGRAAVVGGRCGGRDVVNKKWMGEVSTGAGRWAERACGRVGRAGCGVDARMLQPVARAKRWTGGGGPKTRRHSTRLAWQNLEWRIECRQVPMGGCRRKGRGGKRERKTRQQPCECRERADEKRDVFAAAGNGGELNGRREVSEWEDGSLCVGGKHFAPPGHLARDIHRPRPSMLSALASASRLGAQSTNDDPHARLPAAKLSSRTATP
jgi:hypothetical protein